MFHKSPLKILIKTIYFKFNFTRKFFYLTGNIMLKIILFMLTFMSLEANYNVCVTTIFQNESPYLKEWIDHHLSVGVEHFVLYNNNSTDDYELILKPYIQRNIVDLIDWPSETQKNEFEYFSFTVQPGAYNHAIELLKEKTKWLAIIDTDEFLISMKDKSIYLTLEKYFPKASGVCVNWQCYGTSSIFLKPGQSLLKSLIYKLPFDHSRNLYYKSIVRLDCVEKCVNPHYCLYLPGFYHVNTNNEAIGMQNTGVYIDILRINHYWARDEWFLLNIKAPRYEKWGVNPEDIIKVGHDMNHEIDALF